MRRLGRRTLNALTMLSLLLCVATEGMRLRSYEAVDYCVWQSRGSNAGYQAASAFGEFSLSRTSVPVGYQPFPTTGFSHFACDTDVVSERMATPDLGPPLVQIGRFGVFTNPNYMFGWRRSFSAPYWACACGFAFLPLSRAIRLLRARQRIKSKKCRTCSYDLTGNVSGVCPECGTRIIAEVR